MPARFAAEKTNQSQEMLKMGKGAAVNAIRGASLQASERRLADRRERRHRERAVAEWLRSLDRA